MGHIYRHKLAIISNLKRKAAKGIYDSEKAVKAWLHWVTAAAKDYHKTTGVHVNMSTRKEVAKKLEKEYRP